MIPYGKQDISRRDIDEVIRVLSSDFLTQGPEVPRFEALVSNIVGSKFSVAMNSATSALHCACLALGVQKNDLIWTSPITFVASANCAVYCGAKIDFVDINSKTYNICPVELEKKLKIAKQKNQLPKVVIVVHLCGQPAELEKINKLSKIYNFKVIEDASHAIGAKYHNLPVGNCKFSDITIFSFHPVKIITSAEGGMAVTNNEQLFQKMSLLRTHGITKDTSSMSEAQDGQWYYEQIDLGFNYRMTDLQAALGSSQILRLEDFIKKRHLIADKYNKAFEDFPVVTPWQDPNSFSSYHLYVLRVDGKKYNHKEIFSDLRACGIGVNLHYIPVYRHPFYKKFGFCINDFPIAEEYYSEAISIPIYYKLSNKDQNTVIETVKKCVNSNLK
jgi:UDP-4-amino-4,6-dideoxy-N-acetyl-beta-L-altrosamine transaminase